MYILAPSPHTPCVSLPAAPHPSHSSGPRHIREPYQPAAGGLATEKFLKNHAATRTTLRYKSAFQSQSGAGRVEGLKCLQFITATCIETIQIYLLFRKETQLGRYQGFDGKNANAGDCDGHWFLAASLILHDYHLPHTSTHVCHTHSDAGTAVGSIPHKTPTASSPTAVVTSMDLNEQVNNTCKFTTRIVGVESCS